jgi:hypothetical protein
VQNSTLSDNLAYGGYMGIQGGGGGIEHDGMLTVQNSNLSGNYAGSSGGGI